MPPSSSSSQCRGKKKSTRARCSSLLKAFESPTEPSITLEKYLRRISKYLKCSTETFVLAFAYIERLVEKVNLQITPLNEHRLVLMAIRVASKYLDDKHYDNKYFSEIGGIKKSELNFLELAFSYALAFRLYVSTDQFQEVSRRLTTPKFSSKYERSTYFDELEESLRSHIITREARARVSPKATPRPKKTHAVREKYSNVLSTPPTPKRSPDAINNNDVSFMSTEEPATKGDPETPPLHETSYVSSGRVKKCTNMTPTRTFVNGGRKNIATFQRSMWSSAANAEKGKVVDDCRFWKSVVELGL